MIDDAAAEVSPGLRQPELVAEFQAQTAAATEAEFLDQLAALAIVPTQFSRDFLVDLLVDLEATGQTARARSALPIVARALADVRAIGPACLRLLVNLHFALAVLLMKEVRKTHGGSFVTDESLATALRYHYRFRCAALDRDGGASPAEQLACLRSATADIADAGEQVQLHDLIEPRIDPAFVAGNTEFTSEAITVSPPWLADAAGRLEPAAHEAIRQRSLGFALLRDAIVIGCRSTIFFGDHLAVDDPLGNMAPAEFSPFGMESAYIGVVYGLAADAGGKRHLIARRPSPMQEIPRGIFLNGHYQYNYFHWLAEYLSQFTYVNEQAAYADWPLLIGEEALAHPNLVELLQRLAGDQQRSVTVLRKDVAYRIGELLLPPKISRVTLCHRRLDSRPEDYAFAPGAIQRLHRRLARPVAAPWRRLFLARKRNDRLLNQDAVRAEFERAGFEAIHPEDLPFDQACRLFGEAKVLAGVTGAAFTNLILCPPATTAILMTTDLGRRAGFFSALAGPLGQRVIYLHGPGRQSEHTLSPFEIAPADVRSALAQVVPAEPTPPQEHA